MESSKTYKGMGVLLALLLGAIAGFIVLLGVMRLYEGKALAWDGVVSENLTWTYNWVGPTAIKQGTNVYLSGLNSSGTYRLWKRDSSNNLAYASLATAPEVDDHNTPAVLAQDNKNVVVFYTRHNDDKVMHYKVASAGSLTFGSDNTLTYSDTITYAQVWSYGDKVILVNRLGRCQWVYRVSEDYAATWGNETVLFDVCANNDLVYAMIQPTPTAGVFHLSFYSHPNQSTWKNILVGKLDLTNGNITDSTGTVANIDGTGLPLDETDLDHVDFPTTDRTTRYFDIGTKQGKTYGWYAQQIGDNGWKYYYFYQNTDGTITRVNSNIAAPPFYGTYLGGAALDRNGNNTLYLSEKASTGTQPWKLKQYTINSDMSITLVSTQADSASPLVRPVAPIGQNSVFFQRLGTYNDFTDFTPVDAYERTRD